MTKVMKLNIYFSGYYGGHVDETVLLPLDINGVLFEELEEGEYEDAVYLGEIEGKHSECIGDLTVEFIDLDKLSHYETTKLIEESDFNSYFEGYFDIIEGDFCYSENFSEDKIKKLLKKYGFDSHDYDRWLNTDRIYHKFIEQLKEKYVKRLKTIVVLEEDYDDIISFLKDADIEFY